MKAAPIDESCVLIEGEWTHRFVSANGTRFHIAEAGAGPLVLLLHGFPEFWGAWRTQLTALADAGFRAVAVDLRGYGASDKPPRGYDGYTMAADVTGLIRAIGERDATLVGSGYGGLVAWTTAALHPRSVRRLVVLAAAHPLRLRVVADERSHGPTRRGRTGAQVPTSPVRARAHQGRCRRRWRRTCTAGPGRPGGRRRTSPSTSAPVATPSRSRRPRSARWRRSAGVFAACSACTGTGSVSSCGVPWWRPPCTCTANWIRWCCPRQLRAPAGTSSPRTNGAWIEGVGHFPHREAPDLVAGEILRWAKEG